MNKKLYFFLISSWIIISRILDVYYTYQFTPDLSKEANPIVSIFGISSWSILSFIITVVVIYVIYTFYLVIFKPFDLLPNEKGYSYSNIIAYLFLGVKESWLSVFYKFPKSYKRMKYYIGHILPVSFAYVGLITTIMWLLINNTESFYTEYYRLKYVLVIILLPIVSFIFVWTYLMYKKYLNKLRIN
ncbi:hypothetical protein EI427_16405 [Flammeovirga pectinis]|uniref:Uncharacterized protein n=1 Tax=Flammeovirga pectinis TaxID=2494373 RepID=A0A3S9P6D4_9BACT|nr:hypothetical protein [Flammeovirga pectinis]AZQ63748.1 hypothetical protein EI427_16405 [Flammeovirga pectinis]